MDKKLLYFHGSSLPPGTDSKELRRPCLEQPFFVADNPKAAIKYAKDTNIQNASIFILVAKKPLNEIAFNLSSSGNVSALSKKFPKLVEYIDKYRNTNFFSKYPSKRSFFEMMGFMTMTIVQLATLDDGWTLTSKFSLPKSQPQYDDNDSEQKINQVAVEIFKELGLAHISGNTVVLDGKAYSALKSINHGVDEDVKNLRRLVKSIIYEGIFDLGFKVIMDDDTTGMDLPGNEYAILDMDVFEGGYSKSIHVIGASDAIQKIGEMQ